MRVLSLFIFILTLLFVMALPSQAHHVDHRDIQVFVTYRNATTNVAETVPLEYFSSDNSLKENETFKKEIQGYFQKDFPILRNKNLPWQKNLILELEIIYDLTKAEKQRKPSIFRAWVRVHGKDGAFPLRHSEKVVLSLMSSGWGRIYHSTSQHTQNNDDENNNRVHFLEHWHLQQKGNIEEAKKEYLLQFDEDEHPNRLNRATSGYELAVFREYDETHSKILQRILSNNGPLSYTHNLSSQAIDLLYETSKDPAADIVAFKQNLVAEAAGIPQTQQKLWFESKVAETRRTLENLLQAYGEKKSTKETEVREIERKLQQLQTEAKQISSDNEALSEKFERLKQETENYLNLNHRFLTEFRVQFDGANSGLELVPSAEAQKHIKALVEGALESKLLETSVEAGRLDEKNIAIRITPKVIGYVEQGRGFWRKKKDKTITLTARAELVTPSERRLVALDSFSYQEASGGQWQLASADKAAYQEFFDRIGAKATELARPQTYRDARTQFIESSYLKRELEAEIKCRDILTAAETEAAHIEDQARAEPAHAAPANAEILKQRK